MGVDIRTIVMLGSQIKKDIIYDDIEQHLYNFDDSKDVKIIYDGMSDEEHYIGIILGYSDIEEDGGEFIDKFRYSLDELINFKKLIELDDVYKLYSDDESKLLVFKYYT